MTKYRVDPSARALRDADDAFTWISTENPDAALTWFDGLIKAMKSLANMPLRCSPALENPFFKESLRQLPYGRYRIIFSVTGKTVNILHIRHSARLPWDPDADQ